MGPAKNSFLLIARGRSVIDKTNKRLIIFFPSPRREGRFQLSTHHINQESRQGGRISSAFPLSFSLPLVDLRTPKAEPLSGMADNISKVSRPWKLHAFWSG